MIEQEQLSMAIMIASVSHDGQFDKGGQPYILHPLHLMQQFLFDTQLATIAVLHDVIEDSSITLEYLREKGFSERVLSALSLLTHVKGDDYLNDYIWGMKDNYDVIRVKRKDLGHNSDITRLKGIKDVDLKRMKKYHLAFTLLGTFKRDFQEI